MPGAPSRRCGRLLPPPGGGALGPINGLVFGDSLVPGIGTRLATLRPGDTWNEVSIGNLGLDTLGPSGSSGSGAIGTGTNSFKVNGHDVYYVPGARNVAVLLSITHRDVQDIRDANSAIFDRLETLVASVQVLGWAVCICTVPATTEYNDPGGSPYTRPARLILNGWLRSGGSGAPIRAGANYFADTDAIPSFGQADVPISGDGAPYLDGGGIHFTNAGKDVVAPCINAAIPV